MDPQTQQAANVILDDQRVISITISLISALGVGLIACVIWIFNRVMSEIKSYRTDSLNQRAEFNNALNNKFKALNFYMKETDKMQIRHEEKLNVFHDHARDVKLKLLQHDEALGNHSKKLYEHDIEIKNLKKQA